MRSGQLHATETLEGLKISLTSLARIIWVLKKQSTWDLSHFGTNTPIMLVPIRADESGMLLRGACHITSQTQRPFESKVLSRKIHKRVN